MSAKPSADPPGGGFQIADIYFVLFRHKWKILLLSAMGLCAAAGVLIIKPAPYQSMAKLQIKLEVDRPAQLPGEEAAARSLDVEANSVIISEIESLKSWDVGLIVATNLGPARILGRPAATNEYEEAAITVMRNLLADAPTKGSVLTVIFQSPDKNLVQEGLREIISTYLQHHANLRHIPITPGAMIQETNRLRVEIAATEEELRIQKTNVGISSLVEDKNALIDRMKENAKELSAVQADLAQHEAMARNLGGSPPEANANGSGVNGTNQPAAVSMVDLRDAYNDLLNALKLDKGAESNYLNVLHWNPGRPEVKDVQARIADEKRQIAAMEDAHPGLKTAAAPILAPAPGDPSLNPAVERNAVVGLQAKKETLETESRQIRAKLSKLEEMEPSIRSLEQRRTRLEDDLNYFLRSLDQAALNQSMGLDKEQQGIGYVSMPTPPVKAYSKPFKKKVAMVALSGIIAGLGLAFFIELVLDRSVKRPGEVENKLRLPLFISIPDVKHNGHRATAAAARPLLGNGESTALTITAGSSKANGGNVEVAPWDRRHSLYRFYEGLRDRLIVYFEVRNLVHKPKLVAVTSCNKGAGVSTIAAGLAASLSQTGDGNVLLVDMNEEQGAAQQFYKGKPGCDLNAALESGTMNTAHVDGHLYVATEKIGHQKVQRVAAGGLANLMPKLKASEYDYIIFDMPAVSQTSVTARLAGLMDMVLLVIESEKTNQDVVKRVTALLGESKAVVNTVLNKTRSYVPRQLHQDTLEDI